jgi:hypothetical protein
MRHDRSGDWCPGDVGAAVLAGLLAAGEAGTGCSRGRSSASISAEARRVTRCGRALTCSQNPAQAASSAAKLP